MLSKWNIVENLRILSTGKLYLSTKTPLSLKHFSPFSGEQASDEEKEVESLDEAANDVEDEQTEVNDVSDEEEQDEDEDEEQGN